LEASELLLLKTKRALFMRFGRNGELLNVKAIGAND
jgi:hypothetical protein